MLKAKTRWHIQEQPQEQVKAFADSLGIGPLAATLLLNRGINDIDQAHRFLHPLQADFYDPFLLDGMQDAVTRIEEAIAADEKVLIFGDYDADGVSSTVIMLKALRRKGANVDFYIPNRFTEGYGPNKPAFRYAKEQGYHLIITVDTGISALEEALEAEALGLDLIITDHHEPQPELPKALAIIHPNKPGSTYPFKELAGAGVALKVAHALLGEAPDELVEIAAIGTIADLVPLRDENRLLAARGVNALRNTQNYGLKALFSLSSIERKNISEETVGFALGPRINAAGRLDSAAPAVHLLMADEKEEAEQLADAIDAMNKQRQQLVNKMTEEAIEEVEENYPPDENAVLVIARPHWNAGVIGIVASRLVDRYFRPVIVLSIDHDTGFAKGSARSIAGFDMFANLSKCRDILPHFGGHPMAAGMTLAVDDIEKLRRSLNEFANEMLTEEDFVPTTMIELFAEINDIDIKTIEEIKRLAPFGVKNPKPKVVIKNSALKEARKIGSNKNHLKAVLHSGEATLDVIGFGFGEKLHEMASDVRVSVVGELDINEWNGYRKPQLMLQDLAVAEWQLFDWRGAKNIEERIGKLDAKKTVILTDNQSKASSRLAHLPYQSVTYEEAVSEGLDLTNRYAVLFDLPHSKQQLNELFSDKLPERIYAVFTTESEHFFSTLPEREHFKWYYAFLHSKKQFDLNKFGTELSRRKGWSSDTIKFMSQVFFELDFVTIENGFITFVENPVKQDISSSKTYQRKKAQLECEQDFYYSSYAQLKSVFDEWNTGLLQFEEATK